MKKKIIMVLVVAIFGFAGLSSAAELTVGTKELGVYGSINNISADGGPDVDFTMIQASYGQFITPEMQVGGNVMIFDADGSKSITLAGEGKFHFIQFPDELILPYAGAHLGIYRAESETGFSFGVMVGAKYSIKEDTNLNAELRISQQSYGDVDALATILSLGYSVYFK